MTVESIYVPVSNHGNGATVAFFFPYQFFEPSDLIVRLFDLSTNSEVAPAPALNGGQAFDYRVTGTIDDEGTGEYLNGTVTFNTAPPANYQITIERKVAALQSVSLADDSLFPAKSVEAELDRLQMEIQEGSTRSGRAITAPPSDGPVNLVLPPAAERADTVLTFDDAGNIANPGIAVGPLDAAIAALLAGVSPAGTTAGWARTLATALVLYAAPVVLADGQPMVVDCRASANDGYGGTFAYKAGDAATVFSQSGLGFVDAAGRRWFRLHEAGYVSARWFAAADGVVDDTAAVASAGTAVQAAGGGMLYFPPGTYNVAPAKNGTTMVTFAGLNGIIVLGAAGATIVDTNVYTGGIFTDLRSEIRAVGEVAYLFDFIACRNVDVRLRVQSQAAVAGGSSFARGPWAVSLLQGCVGVHVDIDMVGGLGALRINRAFSDPASTISKNISGKIRAVGTEYPYASQFGSDDVSLQINATLCGRPFFVYGSRAQRLTVQTKDIQIQGLVSAFNGFGCEDVSIDYLDRDSTLNRPASPRFGLVFGDATPAVHRNIRLRVNLKNPAAPNNWGHTLGFYKYSDGGTTADVTGRGHLIDGFELTGEMEGDGTVNHSNMEAGAFAAPDSVQNVNIHNLMLTGPGALSLPLQTLTGAAQISNVKTPANIWTQNGTRGLVVFDACTAGNFTPTLLSLDTHEYRSCVITDGTAQNLADNKTISGKGLFYGGFWKNGLHRVTSAVTINGSLTGPGNLFLVAPVGNGVSGTIRYHLIADNSDVNPATRNETRGAKSFCATIDGAGAWQTILGFADEITQRNTLTASVVTFSLVNGSVAGGYIAVACTNYGGANAAGDFSIEIDSPAQAIAVNPA